MGLKIYTNEVAPNIRWDMKWSLKWCHFESEIIKARKCDYYGVDPIVAKKYISSTVDHISLISKAGRALGISKEQLIDLDRSKFDREEFTGLALGCTRWAYWEEKAALPSTYDEEKERTLYNRAWACHISKNKHHWEHWKGERIPDDNYVMEMVAEWIGTYGWEGGEWTMYCDWFIKNMPKINLHPETGERVKEIFIDIGYADEISGCHFGEDETL